MRSTMLLIAAMFMFSFVATDPGLSLAKKKKCKNCGQSANVAVIELAA